MEKWYSPVLSCKRESDGGLNSVFGHIFTKNYCNIKTGVYFALQLFVFASFYYTLF